MDFMNEYTQKNKRDDAHWSSELKFFVKHFRTAQKSTFCLDEIPQNVRNEALNGTRKCQEATDVRNFSRSEIQQEVIAGQRVKNEINHTEPNADNTLQ